MPGTAISVDNRDRARGFIGPMMAAVVFASPAAARAADMAFMGQQIDIAPGKYLVEKDVNVRDRPATDGNRVGKLEEGDVVDIVGRLPGTVWMAVKQNNAPLGFVYGSLLSPLINGEIVKDVTGEVQVAAAHRCGFRIHFVGKTESEEPVIRTSDYDASIVCERKGKRIRFPAQMFMTEIPFDDSNKKVFQINVDLLDSVHGLTDVFSTVMLFDLEKGQVRFDQGSEPNYVKSDATLDFLAATNVERALASAIHLAFLHWSESAWDDIFTNAR